MVVASLWRKLKQRKVVLRDGEVPRRRGMGTEAPSAMVTLEPGRRSEPGLKVKTHLTPRTMRGTGSRQVTRVFDEPVGGLNVWCEQDIGVGMAPDWGPEQQSVKLPFAEMQEPQKSGWCVYEVHRV